MPLAALAVVATLAGCASVASTATASVASRVDALAPTPSPYPTPTPGADGRLPALEIPAIYSGSAPDLRGYDPTKLRVVVATGDFVPARVSTALMRQHNSFVPLWGPVTATLKSGDITVLNVGDAITTTCPTATTGSTFCGDTRILAPMMAASAPSVVANVANNHITNFGQQGLDETIANLSNAGAHVSGFDQIPVINVRGVRFAFVGIDFVAHRITLDHMKLLIDTARSQADVVVAQIHGGKEYETYPQAGLSQDPKVLDHVAIDDGADIVIGNFPHCAEGSEIYKGKMIAYAQGNFLFDQDWSIGTQESVVGRYYFYGTQLVAVQYVPLRVVGQTTPTPLDPATGEGRKILDRIARSSREIAGLQAPFYPDLSDGNNACT